VREESIERFMVSRRRSLTGVHARRNASQERPILGTERANGNVIAARLG
jgi:hypothetical protein